jgi:hypothetical protein
VVWAERLLKPCYYRDQPDPADSYDNKGGTMMKAMVGVLVLVCFVCVSLVYAGGFKVYPGAKLDEKETKNQEQMAKQAKMATRSKVYVTDDAFEKVKEFYSKIGTEYKMPHQKPGEVEKLPSGTVLKSAFFIFDNTKSLATSKNWAKVQRPFIGPDLTEGPDKTYIITVEK